MIPTKDPLSGNDTFFNFNINGPGSTGVSSYTSASGDMSIIVTPLVVVPEPSSGVSLLFGLIGLIGVIGWRRNCAGDFDKVNGYTDSFIGRR